MGEMALGRFPRIPGEMDKRDSGGNNTYYPCRPAVSKVTSGVKTKHVFFSDSVSILGRAPENLGRVPASWRAFQIFWHGEEIWPKNNIFFGDLADHVPVSAPCP